MKNFVELLGDGYSVYSCGTNSIILRKNGSVFKITREFSAEQIETINKKMDCLHASGVFVPQMLSASEVSFVSAAEFDLLIGQIMQAKQSGCEISLNDVERANTSGNYVLPMIEYEFVNGSALFSHQHMTGLEIINRNKCFKDAKTLHPQVLANLMRDLDFNLKMIEKIKPGEIYKFLCDGEFLLDNGFFVDNVTGENFVYGTSPNGKQGFWFLDVGVGDSKSEKTLAEINLFKFSVDNLCKMLFVDTLADLGNAKARQADCFYKISGVVEQFLSKHPECKAQFDEYLANHNYYVKLMDNIEKTFVQKQLQ